ncbi:MAG: DUF1501 domain-containing protein [Methylococcaceae bacterium]
MDRRQFLRWSLGAVATGCTWRVWATPAKTNTRFLMVFLRGGYDALSVLTPYSESFYYEMRPNIALAKPNEDDPNSLISLNDYWGLNPILHDSLYPLYQAKQLAFVPFSGTGFESRSHFQTQDWLEFGQGATVIPNGGSGFLNRLLSHLSKGVAGKDNAVSFTQNLPIALQGGIAVANSPVNVHDNQTMTANYEQLLQSMYKGHALETLAKEGLGLRHKISDELQQEMQSASRDAVPAQGFALEAKRVATLLKEQPNYNIGFIDVGGWDTHIDQGADHGQLARHLDNLGTGLAALANTLGPTEWKNTVVAVVSEFGRTFQENGSKGTDHGYGSTLLLLGGGLHGGAIKGEHARLNNPSALHEQRDTPMLNEYRDVLGGLFKQMYGLNANALQDVFPHSKPRDLGLL